MEKQARNKGNIDKERKFLLIMAIHVLVVWSLSTWSYSGTSSGEVVRKVFKLASGTVTLQTGYNWTAIFLAPLLLLVGIPLIHYLLKWRYN